MRAETPESAAAPDVEAAVAARDAEDSGATRRGDAERATAAGVCRVCLQTVSLSEGAKGVDGSDAGDAALRTGEGEDVVLLGCACSQPCHRACMEAWTRTKGDRTCELCHETMVSLSEPGTRASLDASDDASRRDEIAVFVRPVFDASGGHFVFALADPSSEGAGRTHPGQTARLFVRRVRTNAAADGAGGETDGGGPARRRGCSECVSLALFALVFVLVFGGPGLVFAGIYVLWFLWLRAVTG